MKKVTILSIDGGGIRGIIPGIILMRLEKILQQLDNNLSGKIGEYFDFIAGTSTGGILACLYLMPDGNGGARYSAAQAVDLYLTKGDDIFSRTIVERLRSFDGIFREKYSVHTLQDQLDQYFGDTMIAQSIRPCLITSYEITQRRAVFFTRVDPADDLHNFKFSDAARATSAAPTYFEPAKIYSAANMEWSLVDGGVFANNPALCAYAEARKIDFKQALNKADKPKFPTAKDMMILSLGTGSVTKPYDYERFENAGEIKWIHPIIDILMSGNAETVNYQLHQMFLTLQARDQDDYHRLEPALGQAASEMDLATPANIEHLRQAGLAFVESHIAELTKIAGKILANR